MKTYSPKRDHIERRWYVIDASDKVLGRVASEAARLLRGKHKPIFAPHMDTGDHVIVVNADKVVVTGGKETKKYAYRHSGYPGGISATRYDELLRTRPVYAVEKAIKGMLPKNRLGRSMARKLHVVPGPDHPHAAQRPVEHELGDTPAWNGLPAPRPVTELKTRHRRPAEADVQVAEEPATEETGPPKPASRPSTSRKTTAKKTTAKRSVAKKTAAKKSTAKKTTASKTTAKKSTAKKTTAKKSTARRSTARTSKAADAPAEPAEE